MYVYQIIMCTLRRYDIICQLYPLEPGAKNSAGLLLPSVPVTCREGGLVGGFEEWEGRPRRPWSALLPRLCGQPAGGRGA